MSTVLSFLTYNILEKQMFMNHGILNAEEKGQHKIINSVCSFINTTILYLAEYTELARISAKFQLHFLMAIV
jgi:hypothetical protein